MLFLLARLTESNTWVPIMQKQNQELSHGGYALISVLQGRQHNFLPAPTLHQLKNNRWEQRRCPPKETAKSTRLVGVLISIKRGCICWGWGQRLWVIEKGQTQTQMLALPIQTQSREASKASRLPVLPPIVDMDALVNLSLMSFMLNFTTSSSYSYPMFAMLLIIIIFPGCRERISDLAQGRVIGLVTAML